MTVRDYVMTITDGTTTKTITSSPFAFSEYLPNAPDPQDIDSIDDDATISETCVIRVMDGSVANNIAEIQDIQTLFDQARKAQDDTQLARVYLTLKIAVAATEYRSEIIVGKSEYDDEAMNYAQWVNNVFLVKLFWTRRYYWEATTATQIQVTNHLVTNNTNGAPIYNPSIRISATTIAFVSGTKKITDSGNGLAYFLNGDTIVISGTTGGLNDGTFTIATGGVAGEIVTNEALTEQAAGPTVVIVGANCNYVQIAAADVAGIINSPIRLEIVNAHGAEISYKDFHVGISHMPSMSNFSFFLEGEDGTQGGGAASATDTASGACSGGKYCAYVWINDTEKELATWTLPAAMLAAARGAYFMVLARLQAGTIDALTKLRLSIKLSTSTIYQGPLIALDASDYLQDLGAIQLPPNLLRQTAPKALTLALSGKKVGGSTINLDFLEFMPIDSYRNLKQIAYGAADGDSIYIDEIQKPELVYGVDGAGKYYATYIPRGERLKLQKATLQRIYMLFNEQDNTQNINNKSTVKVYYRPRRLSL